jgi:lysyl-tRNA synthetase class 2
VQLNDFGKAAFGHIQDRTGRIQGYFRRNLLDRNSQEIFSRLDVGDIIGIQGKLFRTRSGELTLLVEGMVLLAKSLRPLPEKWHGLTDQETRTGNAYVDLIVTPHTRNLHHPQSNRCFPEEFFDGPGIFGSGNPDDAVRTRGSHGASFQDPS